MSQQTAYKQWVTPLPKHRVTQFFTLTVADGCHRAIDALFGIKQVIKQTDYPFTTWQTSLLASIMEKATEVNLGTIDAVKNGDIVKSFVSAFELTSELISGCKICGMSFDVDKTLTIFVDDIFSDDADKVITSYYKWFDNNRDNGLDFQLRETDEMEQAKKNFFFMCFSK